MEKTGRPQMDRVLHVVECVESSLFGELIVNTQTLSVVDINHRDKIVSNVA